MSKSVEKESTNLVWGERSTSLLNHDPHVIALREKAIALPILGYIFVAIEVSVNWVNS